MSEDRPKVVDKRLRPVEYRTDDGHITHHCGGTCVCHQDSEPVNSLKGGIGSKRGRVYFGTPTQEAPGVSITNLDSAAQRFMENAAKEIEGYALGDPRRESCAERLHKMFLDRFMPEEPTKMLNTKQLAGCRNVARDGNNEDGDILSKFDDAEDGAESDCEDGEREPRLKPLKLRLSAVPKELRKRFDKDLKVTFDLPSSKNVDRTLPVVTAAGLEDADGNFTAPTESDDSVSAGEIFFEDKGYEEQSWAKVSHRPYHDRVSRVLFNEEWRRRSKMVDPSLLTCARCGKRFAARRGTKFCSDNCRKRFNEEQKIVAKVKG